MHGNLPRKYTVICMVVIVVIIVVIRIIRKILVLLMLTNQIHQLLLLDITYTMVLSTLRILHYKERFLYSVKLYSLIT